MSFAGTSVVFELNDLSEVKPPADALGEEEVFLGPVADEFGMRFFLVFDERLKIFHYMLDETVAVADELVAAKGLDHVLIGRRTGFAFFQDIGRVRKLLVGVYAANVDVNNYLDGPFDQLPDNFLKGDELRRGDPRGLSGHQGTDRPAWHFPRRRVSQVDLALSGIRVRGRLGECRKMCGGEGRAGDISVSGRALP